MSNQAIGDFYTAASNHNRIKITNWKIGDTVYGSPSSTYWADVAFEKGGVGADGYAQFYAIEGRYSYLLD